MDAIADQPEPDPGAVPGLDAFAQKTPEWEMLVLNRIGKPPLRFRGNLIARTVAPGPDTPKFEICLWQKKSGGFTISHMLECGGSLRDHAANVRSLPDAINYIEDLCESLPLGNRSICRKDIAPRAQLLDAIGHLQRQSAFLQRFRLLAGRAIAEWEDRLPGCTVTPSQERV